MRILYLAHRIPYPPNKGEKIRAYHHVRHLASRHEVHLLSFVDQPEEAAGAAVLRQWCANVELIPLDRTRALLRGVRALATGRSLSEGFFGSRAMSRAVARAAAGQPFDVAWAFSSSMAPYLLMTNARRRVADFVDVDSEKWRQFAQVERPPLAVAYRLEARRVRALERRVASSVDRVLLVSWAEAELLRSSVATSAAVRVIGNGVDIQYFRRTSVAPAAPVMLFTGALDYRPNIDAVLFGAHEVLPRVARTIPDVRFIAVGHRPAARLLREADAHGEAFRVAGSVPDIRPYFEAARVYMAPLQLGRGVQNKILEAMAMRVPVVASPLAVAGLEVEPGRHVVVCNTADQFAEAIVSLLRNEQRCRELADAAGHLIEQRYTWARNLALVDACLEETLDASSDQPARVAAQVA